MPFEAAKSLFRSTSSRKALAGNVGGQAREQTVLTPSEIVAQLVATAGRRLALDPCTVISNPTGAAFFRCGIDLDYSDDDNGLETDWLKMCLAGKGFFYSNPPFGDLEAWMAKALKEGARGAPGYLLGPFRPQRSWFGGLLPAGECLALKPFPFVGSKSAFPAPLFLAAYGGLRLPKNIMLTSPGGRARKNIVIGKWRFEK